MRRALELAALGRGLVSPNPMVGAVVVRDGRVVGEGWHEGPGIAARRGSRAGGRRDRGARRDALLHPRALRSRGTDAAVHRARSSRRVSRGSSSPRATRTRSSTVAGSTACAPRGIEVVDGVLEEPARRLNAAFERHVMSGLPLVTLKMRRVARRQDGRDGPIVPLDHG